MARGPEQPKDGRAARAAALDALSRRDHASADLAQKLVAKGFAPDIVVPLIERLLAEKLLDDRRYVDNFVAYHAARGQGPMRVRAELRKFGLQGEIVEEVLASFPDWLTHARKVRQKKFGDAPPGNYPERQRQARFLSYRGFTSAQIGSALGFHVDLGADDEGS